MSAPITAVVENGLLRPTTPLGLADGTHVRLTVAVSPAPAAAPTPKSAAATIVAEVAAFPDPSAGGDALPADVTASVAALQLLTDDELRQAAQTRLAAEAAERLEELHFRQQRAAATDADRAEMAALTRQYQAAVLVRAKAVEHLLARGRDVTGLLGS